MEAFDLGESVNYLGELRMILIRLNMICVFSFPNFLSFFPLTLLNLLVN